MGAPGFDVGEFRFAPGQFNMLYVFGVGEVAISISGDPARPERARAHHPRRRLGDRRRWRALRRGATRRRARPVRQPRGRSTRREGGDVVIVAGGLGLAPLRPGDLPRRCGTAATTAASSILYGARTPGRAPLPRRARALAQRARRDGRA